MTSRRQALQARRTGSRLTESWRFGGRSAATPHNDGSAGESSWLAAIVHSSSDAIISLTLNCVMQSWNRGAERLYGYSAAEAIGQPISILIPKHRAGEEARILEKCDGASWWTTMKRSAW